MAVKLKAKQERFCQEYIKDGNGAQAAIRAGYAPKAAKQVASRMLTFANVKARIAELQGRLENKAVMARQETLEEITLLARTDIADYLDIDDGGTIKVKPFDQMPKGASRCIRKIKEKRVIRQAQGDTEDMIMESTLEFELWSKPDALDMLGRHHELFTAKEGGDDKPIGVTVTFTDAKKSPA